MEEVRAAAQQVAVARVAAVRAAERLAGTRAVVRKAAARGEERQAVALRVAVGDVRADRDNLATTAAAASAVARTAEAAKVAGLRAVRPARVLTETWVNENLCYRKIGVTQTESTLHWVLRPLSWINGNLG